MSNDFPHEDAIAIFLASLADTILEVGETAEGTSQLPQLFHLTFVETLSAKCDANIHRAVENDPTIQRKELEAGVACLILPLLDDFRTRAYLDSNEKPN